jgi:calmodulin
LYYYQDLRQAFRIFDKNKDGFVDASELKKVTTTLGQKLTNEEVDAFMDEADIDGDGKLSYEEFVNMLTKF